MSRAQDLAEAHWGYTGDLIDKCKEGIDPVEYEFLKFLYTAAFVHGYKHAAEDAPPVDHDSIVKEVMEQVTNRGMCAEDIIRSALDAANL